MPSLAGKGKEILMIAGTAPDPCKSIVKYPAIKILVYYLRYYWSEIPVF